MGTKRTLIIAEAGVNHNGDIEMAKELIRAAAKAGVDYVKFQTFSADKLVTRDAKQADYQRENLKSGKNSSQYEMLKKLELTHDDHITLINTCKKHGVKFLSTPFDNEAIVYLASELNVDYIKIPSGDLTNLPYLRLAASLSKPIILSTGMGDMEEVVAAVNVLVAAGVRKDDICILHCTTEYPAPFEEANIRAMDAIAEATGCRVGYSDHTKGINVAIAAAARGAGIIEKHFTLDRSLPGPDHLASLEPEELKHMVDAIRIVDLSLGDGIKRPAGERELANRGAARKSIVAACHIDKGEVFTEMNITVKRPGTGVTPMRWDEVLGLKAKRSFNEDELIEL